MKISQLRFLDHNEAKETVHAIKKTKQKSPIYPFKKSSETLVKLVNPKNSSRELVNPENSSREHLIL
jgi:hypothetical protein